MIKGVVTNDNLIKSRKQIKIVVALLTVYLLWGGTYLGMREAVATIPPFIMSGIRFLVAGSILYSWARLRGAGKPAKKHWKSAAFIGALLPGSLGMMAWAEQLVPSGIASLLVAMIPVWLIIIGLLGKSRSKPTAGVLFGIVLGLSGLVVLVLGSGKALNHQEVNFGYSIVLIMASMIWAVGSFYTKYVEQPDSALLATGMQMLAGGVLVLMVSVFSGEWLGFHLEQVSFRSYLGWGYSIFFASIIGYNAYIWLLKNADLTWVSTYSFVNPVVAVLLGWVIGGEQITGTVLIAAAIIITAVVLITIYRNRGVKEAG